MATLSSTPVTLLDAVNYLLATIGEAPVDTLDAGDISVYQQKALSALNKANQELQSKGWYFNSYDAYTLPLDEDDKIPVPANTITITRAYWTSGPGVVAPADNVIVKGGYLYNRDAHTYIFTGSMAVDMILLESFEDLPLTARTAIVAKAAHLFQGREQGSSIVYRITSEEVADALALLEQDQDRNAPSNCISGNKAVQNALVGKGVRRRSTGSF